MFKKSFILAIMLMIASPGFAQAARDYINIVGSSTVYPFATVVAETFGKTTGFKTPKIESTGTGGGFKLFCGGVGVAHPDITNASRAIKKSEIDLCGANGIIEVIEVKIGYDGIAIANSKKTTALQFSRKDLFLALAKNVPDPRGGEKLVPNPYKTWKQVNSKLPDVAIEVLGPPPTSGTRDAFVELAMEGGCKNFDWIAAIEKKDEKQYKAICQTIREDGAYVDAGENDNLILQKLQTNPKSLGIFGFNFLDQNIDKVQGSIIDDAAPTFDTIADHSYPISRPLFFYVKKAHVGMIPGIKEYLNEFTSEKAWGDEGYLSDRGLVPLPAAERAEVAQTVKQLKANIICN
ncbi:MULTISPECIES: PstS family phosphate ABC transporter substrate-binding protein [Nitrosomonas]|uniref:Phosphate transport system substrate-binding protein n=2 Tax=Nitrosomonas communis TaxID=44574 RepID=A0A5D3YC13_9PROT|nr:MULTISPECIES: PstS family phosphate ABC transporter substrate-binding protein [Nitrosomonas]TYP88241.1 phosphate transport system substrate-binding protein [Nitrosomonas communis]UVS60973.1 PstS family phosphate ABC transporter substrate-binding protein [Nitrosomonas sp. PLL12]